MCVPQREQDGDAEIDLPLVGPGFEVRLPRAVGAVTLQRVKRPLVEIVRDMNGYLADAARSFAACVQSSTTVK